MPAFLLLARYGIYFPVQRYWPFRGGYSVGSSLIRLIFDKLGVLKDLLNAGKDTLCPVERKVFAPIAFLILIVILIA